MNFNASEFVPAHLRDFPDLTSNKKDYRALAHAAHNAVATSSSHTAKCTPSLSVSEVLKKKLEEEKRLREQVPEVPAGFVVFTSASPIAVATNNRRPRSSSNINENANANVSIVDDDDSDSDSDREEEEEELERPLVTTKMARPDLFSDRWIAIAAAIAAKDRDREKNNKTSDSGSGSSSGGGLGLGPSTASGSIWHQVLSLASMKQYPAYQTTPNQHQQQRAQATTATATATATATDTASASVTCQLQWWRALYTRDEKALRGYVALESYRNMPGLALPSVMESKALQQLQLELGGDKKSECSTSNSYNDESSSSSSKEGAAAAFEQWVSLYRGTKSVQIAAGMGSTCTGPLQVLVDAHPGSIHVRDRRYKRSPLLFACQAGCFSGVQLLLRAGGDLDSSERDRIGDNALHKAVRSGNVQLVGWLCTRWSNQKAINLRNKHGDTPLFLSVTAPRAMAAALIKRGANTFMLNSEGLDAVCLAARSGRADVLSLLLSSCNSNQDGCRIQYATSESWHPASNTTTTTAAAAAIATAAATSMHLPYPSSSSADNSHGVVVCKANPMQLAIRHGHLAAVQALSAHSQTQAAAAREDMVRAAGAGAAGRGSQYAAKHGSSSSKSNGSSSSSRSDAISVDSVTGWSALHYAVINGQAGIARGLLDRKDYAAEDYLLMAEDKQGACALVLAAVFGQSECVSVLVDEVRKRNLPLLLPTYLNSRKEGLLCTFLRMKDPMGLRLSRGAGEDYQLLLHDIALFLSEGVPVGEAFLAEVVNAGTSASDANNHNKVCLLEQEFNQPVDESCCFSVDMLGRYQGLSHALQVLQPAVPVPVAVVNDNITQRRGGGGSHYPPDGGTGGYNSPPVGGEGSSSSTSGIVTEDVVLVCRGKRIPASKRHLAALSPALCGMIRFREQQQQQSNGVLDLPIETMSPAQCMIIAHYSVSGRLRVVEEDEDAGKGEDDDENKSVGEGGWGVYSGVLEQLLALLPIAQELLMADSLGRAVERELVTTQLSFGTAPLLLIASLRYHAVLPSLKACAAKSVLVSIGSDALMRARLFQGEGDDDDTDGEVLEFAVTALDALVHSISPSEE